MKKIMSGLLLLLATAPAAHACDACGCSASGQTLGLLPQHYPHFAGVQYQYRALRNTFPALLEGRPDDQSTQRYHTIQAWGRYALSERVQLYAFVPYQYNTREEKDVRSSNQGLGDVSALVNVVVLKKTPVKGLNHLLLLGGGVKAPTGAHAGVSELDRRGLPNVQPGTGSWDFLLNGNYTLRGRAYGVNLDVSYTLTTANADNYKYGNRLGAGLTAFRNCEAGAWRLVPMAGVRVDHALHDYDNYAERWLNRQTGGCISYGSLGLQVFRQHWGLTGQAFCPLLQDYARGHVKAGFRAETGLMYLF